MKKSQKTYNLALKKQENQPLKLSQECRSLDIIAQIPENSNTHETHDQYQNDKPINIFQVQKYYAEDRINLEKLSPYTILCKKEVDAFKAKLKKIKNHGTASMFRMKASQSFLSSSRQTGTFAELVNSNQCLTKQELVQFYKSTRQTAEKSKKKYKLRTINHDQRFTDTQPNETTLNRTLQLPQMKTCKSSRLPKFFQKDLNLTMLNYDKSNSKTMLQVHRKKMQDLSKFTLKNQKQNIQPISWTKNLRDKGELKKIFDKKYVQSIVMQGEKGLCLKGSNKLDKQYKWIQDKKNNYYEALENKSKFIKRDKSFERFNSDQSRIINYYPGTMWSTGNKNLFNATLI